MPIIVRKLVAYIRVSTDQQGRSGLGIEAQKAAIAHFAEAEGFEVRADSIEDLRGWADRYLESLGGSGVVGVANESSFVLKVSRNLVTDVQANKLAPLMGRGGGKPAGIAQGGGSEPGKLPEALEAARRLASEKLG